MKNLLYVLIMAAVVIGGWWYFSHQRPEPIDFAALAQERPELKEFTDDIERLLAQQNIAPEDQAIYLLELGLAWKSLAERTQDSAHFEESLKAYERGIEITARKNIVFLNNAGNISESLARYEQSAAYFDESTRVSPGDPEAYIRLATIHEEYLGSNPETIIAIYDRGIERMLNSEILAARKRDYLERAGLLEQ